MSEQITVAFPLPITPEMREYFGQWCEKENVDPSDWPDWFVYQIWDKRTGFLSRALSEGLQDNNDDQTALAIL